MHVDDFTGQKRDVPHDYPRFRKFFVQALILNEASIALRMLLSRLELKSLKRANEKQLASLAQFNETELSAYFYERLVQDEVAND